MHCFIQTMKMADDTWFMCPMSAVKLIKEQTMRYDITDYGDCKWIIYELDCEILRIIDDI